MNELNVNNLRLKTRIGKETIEKIINKIVLKKVSNVCKVKNFNKDNVENFNEKFSKEFNEKFYKDEFDKLTISQFVNNFNSEFLTSFNNKVNQCNPSFNYDSRFINNTKKQDNNEDKPQLDYLNPLVNDYKSIYLSKSALKQYIFYHFIPYNSLYVRKNVSYKIIADYCDVSIPTVKNNHRILEEFGLIETVATSFGKVDFKITDENYLHKSKKEGGKGYITMSVDMLEHLLLFDNVNELKVELKKLLWVDAKSGNIGKNVRFNKENLTNMLPNYIQKSKKTLHKIIDSPLSLFNVDRGSLNTAKYQSKNDIDAKFKQSYKDEIIKLFGLNNTAFSKKYANLLGQFSYLKDCGYEFQIKEKLKQLEGLKTAIIDDICDLIMQYGFNKVKNAIDFMFNDYCGLNDELGIVDNEINNPGAFIRVVVRNNIDRFGSLYNTI